MDTLAAVLRLHADYGRLIDAREAEPWSRLFAEDGVLVGARPGGGDVVGGADLAAFAAASPAGVHVCGVPSIDETGPDVVQATSNFVFVGAENGQILAGTYRDRLVACPGGLVFARREVQTRARTRTR
jgi:hypothetical protein